jgi:ribonuclease G
MRRDLLIAAGPGEWLAALVEDGIAVELYVERGDRAAAGSFHLGRVVRLAPALAAVFVDIGEERPAFLSRRDMLPGAAPLAEGGRIVVQITREAQGGKAARVAMRAKLRGERVELRIGSPEPKILVPAAPETIAAEAAELHRQWQAIAARAAALDPPARLDPPASFAEGLAAVMPARPQAIEVDDRAAVPQLRAAFPEAETRYRPASEWPIDLEAEFDRALIPTIALAGGGAVHFEAARTATMIDVDSGTAETGTPERQGLSVNLAAALTIARQVRLRNLGGGIIVDFVGLDRPGLRERVRKAFAAALAADPAGPQVLGWTRLGHLELVRPRRGRPLAEIVLDRAATPPQRSAASVAFAALRALQRAARAAPAREWRLRLAPEVASVLSGKAAAALAALEERLGRRIAVAAEPGLPRERFQLDPV